MPVLNFSYATIKDNAAFHDYVRRAAELMQNHNIETWCGALTGPRCVAVRKSGMLPPYSGIRTWKMPCDFTTQVPIGT